jgi:hypothetical protein
MKTIDNTSANNFAIAEILFVFRLTVHTRRPSLANATPMNALLQAFHCATQQHFSHRQATKPLMANTHERRALEESDDGSWVATCKSWRIHGTAWIGENVKRQDAQVWLADGLKALLSFGQEVAET